MSESRCAVVFQKPGAASVETEPIGLPGPSEVQVAVTCSAVSPGSELLVYRGDLPDDNAADAVDAVSSDLSYPLSYGYAAVGQVVRCGADVDTSDWLGSRVFGFQPHVSRYNAAPASLIRLPEDVSDEAAALLPNVETAVNLVMDARPLLGERVVVFGQGVVGLLATHLLAAFPLDVLVTVDPDAERQSLSKAFGATDSRAPNDLPALRADLGLGGGAEGRAASVASDDPAAHAYAGADLVLECTGRPDVLNDAVSVAGFDGRIVVGSWYGRKTAPLELGGRFHRSRIQIVSSQVSTVRPALRGRWSKTRRMERVLHHLTALDAGAIISHRVPVSDAPALYDRMASGDASILQPLFTYPASSP